MHVAASEHVHLYAGAFGRRKMSGSYSGMAGAPNAGEYRLHGKQNLRCDASSYKSSRQAALCKQDAASVQMLGTEHSMDKVGMRTGWQAAKAGTALASLLVSRRRPEPASSSAHRAGFNARLPHRPSQMTWSQTGRVFVTQAAGGALVAK